MVFYILCFYALQDEKELCFATAQFEDFVLQFMDRYAKIVLPNGMYFGHVFTNIVELPSNLIGIRC